MNATPTRRRILDAALELFNRNGYAATSQAEIAAAAGIRQGNLTYHFPTKLDLVAALRDEGRAVLSRREVLGATDDPKLPEPVDLVLIVNTVHHIGERVAYFERLRDRLRPGARVVIVDFVMGELPVGHARAVQVGLDDLLVCRPEEGRVHVLEDVCSHDDAAIGDQELSEGCVTCPRHGARFDVASGAVRRSPAPVGIATYPARIQDGWVEAELED